MSNQLWFSTEIGRIMQWMCFFFPPSWPKVGLLIALARKSPLMTTNHRFYIIGGGFGLLAIWAGNYKLLVTYFKARQQPERKQQPPCAEGIFLAHTYIHLCTGKVFFYIKLTGITLSFESGQAGPEKRIPNVHISFSSSQSGWLDTRSETHLSRDENHG